MKPFPAAMSALLAASPAGAEGLPVSLSDWGGAGLLAVPSARVLPEGTVASGLTVTGRLSRHVVISHTPVPWLELTARQTLFPGRSRLPDPGLDVKIRLLREGPWWPALAIGGRDVARIGVALPGNGAFAGEYLVATRRWWSFDITAGLGWGRLGERRSMGNPLAGLGGRYNTPRPAADPERRGPAAWFTGDRVAVLAGVEWHAPLDGLSLKLDLDGEAFATERALNPAVSPGWPLSVGLSWRPVEWIDLGAGFENGRRAMVRLSVPLGPSAAKRLEGPAKAPPALDSRRPASPAETGTAGEALALARAAGVRARSARLDQRSATLWIDADEDGSLARDAGRAARVLAALAAPDVEEVTVIAGTNGTGETALTLSRAEVLRLMAGRGSIDEAARDLRLGPPSHHPPDWSTGWSLSVAPTVEQSLFEHASASGVRAFTDIDARLEPWRGLALGAALRAGGKDGTDNLDTALWTAPRPVRSDLWRYAGRPAALNRLYAAWTAGPIPPLTVRLTGGWLEEMFGGVSAEVLYRPVAARWSLGLSADRVRKRDPRAPFRLRGAPFTSVLATATVEPSGDWAIAAETGRYLGGDLGAGLELTRALSDTVRFGGRIAWSGRLPRGGNPLGGRLDVGLTLTVAFSPWRGMPLTGRAAGAVRTLGRDGGQRLDRPLPLGPGAGVSGAGRIAAEWPRFGD